MKEMTVMMRIHVKETEHLEGRRFHASAQVVGYCRPRDPVSGEGATPSQASADAVAGALFGWTLHNSPGEG